MHTKIPTPTKAQDRKISQAESQNLADWLRAEGHAVRAAGSLWKLRPSQVAKIYGIKVENVLLGLRRVEEE
jgi:hypothetical protein